MKLPAILFSALLVASAPASTIAVTEFINNTGGDDAVYEWIELFNYGEQAVNLNNYTISDTVDTFTLPSITIASGGYAVVAADAAAFALEWPTVTVPVIDASSTIALANSSDQIVIANSSSTVIWNLAYQNGESDGRATFLAVDLFTTTDYGFHGVDPAIDRTGIDDTGTLGYENNDATTDPLAFTSNTLGDVGSPGAGNYTVIPEPAVSLFGALGALFLARCRRSRFGVNPRDARS